MDIIIQDNYFTAYFASDTSVNGDGFRLRWECTPLGTTPSDNLIDYDNWSNGSSGVIELGNYKDDFTKEWHVRSDCEKVHIKSGDNSEL